MDPQEQKSENKPGRMNTEIEKILAKHSVEQKRGKDGFEYVECSEPLKLIEDLARSGDWLMHGTTRRIVGDLEPRQARDDIKESGNRKAVYLTRNPVLVMFTALTGGTSGERKNKIGWEIDNQTGEFRYPVVELGVADMNQVKDEGYVYVGRNGLNIAYENGEYVSPDPVKPELLIKIKKDQFKFEVKKL